jgi:hypothetical protein
MNVYFCDVCGVRVTDLDLHSGHGMRRRNDVICAACLELGHGKGWVANHAQKQQMAFAGAGAAVGISEATNAVAEHEHELEAPSAKHPTPVPAVEMARDRLRTLDDDHPPQVVPPVQLDAALADLELPPAPPALDEPVATDDTAKVQVLHQELSTAAAGFAALTPPVITKHVEEPEDDLQEAHNARLDDSEAAGVLSDQAATPEQELEAEKAETASNSAVHEGTAVTVESKRKASTSRSAPRGRSNTASSSSKVSKVSKSSKSRSVKRGKPGIPPIMLLSAAGIALIVLIGAFVIVHANSGAKETPQTITTKINTDLLNLKKEALAAVADGMSTKDMGKLEEAKAKIRAVKEKAAEFETAATNAHWTEDQINDWMEKNELADLYSQTKTINDQEDILKQQDPAH